MQHSFFLKTSNAATSMRNYILFIFLKISEIVNSAYWQTEQNNFIYSNTKQLDTKFCKFGTPVSIDLGSQSLKAMFVEAVEDTLHSLNKHFIEHCIWKQLGITAIFAEVELIAQQSKTPKCHFSFLKH